MLRPSPRRAALPPSLVPSPLPRSLPPCAARFPPPAARGCDVRRPLPPPPLTDGPGAPPAPGSDPAARGRASEVKPPLRRRPAGGLGPVAAAAARLPGGAGLAGVPGWVGWARRGRRLRRGLGEGVARTRAVRGREGAEGSVGWRVPRAAGRAGCRSSPSGAALVGTGGRWASGGEAGASLGSGSEVGSAVPSAPDGVQTVTTGVRLGQQGGRHQSAGRSVRGWHSFRGSASLWGVCGHWGVGHRDLSI